ncbi:MAG: GGDEF domain-containing protein [Spirochaetales bacterium]|nr:GGDEF domain-containing protein [Spirochaetales bacterium]
MEKRSYNELFASEALRGERIHWKINWVIYSVLILLSMVTYRFQGNRASGTVGMVLGSASLLYNGYVGYLILHGKPRRILGYITITLNVIALTAYNYIDAHSNSPVLTATSAAVLIYPLVIFLASLRMDRILVLYSTILCSLVMNLLYMHFHGEFDLGFPPARISADWLSQIYRTVYLLVMGYMICTVPRSMRRVLRKQEDLMREKTYHQAKAERDPLTSLYNRYYLESYFEEGRGKYALMYIDLNDFKEMNDTHGHDFGDYVLLSIGEDLNRIIRNGDLVARIGGDELVVLFSLDSASIPVEEMAERVSRAILKPRTYRDIQFTVKASIGVALYPDHADNLDRLLKKADQAMYEIKRKRTHGIAYASL